MSCYLCLDKETLNNTFCDTNICNCKGSNRIHKICYSKLRFNGENICSICKSPYKQNVKRVIVESDNYMHTSTKIYINDKLQSIDANISSIICCNIM
jgi:hypothetical protein